MRKIALGFLLLVAITLVGLSAHQGRASATAACTPPCVGYFNGGVTNSFPGNMLNVLSAGLNANDAPTMANILANDLNFGSYQDQIGAAFIIDNMLGQGSFAGRGGSGAGVAYAKANFGTWQNLVNYYASSSNPGAYGVQWNVFRSGISPNSAFLIDINDDAYHNYVAGVDDGPVIRFYWPGGEFLIERVCGNLEGTIGRVPGNSPPSGSISVSCNFATGQQVATINFGDSDGATSGYISTGGWNSGVYSSGGYSVPIPPPPTTSPYAPQPVTLIVYDSGPVGTGLWIPVASANTQTPCVTLSCGSMTVTPSLIDPSTKFAITVTVTNNVNQPPPGANMSINVSAPGYNYSASQPAGGGGAVSSATFNNIGPTNSGGTFTVTWTLSSPFISKSCPGIGQPPQTFPIVNLPYLNVFGGDVMTGASASYNAGATTCATNANAGVFSWNNHSTDFSGAGAQYAVQALGQIVDFASAQNSASPTPVGLTFADAYSPPDASKMNTALGLFGGNFGATVADCDFTSDLGAPITTNTIIGNITVPVGQKNIMYIKGANVYITGNGVKYAAAGGSWADVGKIPQFKLIVVGGNIYIDRGVTQLDGLYVAEPDGANGGTIYTCAYGLGVAANPTIPGYYSACNNQLVVNGAFVAKQVQLLRTNGTLGQANATDSLTSNHSAEVFNYTPELWLPRNNIVNDKGYSAITGLPPVL